MTEIENKYTFEKQNDILDESGIVGGGWQEGKMTEELLVIFSFFLACKVNFCIERFECGNRTRKKYFAGFDKNYKVFRRRTEMTCKLVYQKSRLFVFQNLSHQAEKYQQIQKKNNSKDKTI